MENNFEHSRGTISSSPQKEGAPPRRPSLGFEEAFILGYNVERFRRDARMDLLSLPSYANGPEFCRYSCRARASDRHKNAHYIPHSRMDACDEEPDEGLETGSSDEL